jgi:hypothetical protein
MVFILQATEKPCFPVLGTWIRIILLDPHPTNCLGIFKGTPAPMRYTYEVHI